MAPDNSDDLDAVIDVLKTVWVLVLIAVMLAALVLLPFGALLLGDEIGLWQFDSGLGAEKGDGP